MYSLHSWRRAGRSRVSRPPRHNEPNPPGTRVATKIEVYEHGRWRCKGSSEDMPAHYNHWDLPDRLAISLLCMWRPLVLWKGEGREEGKEGEGKIWIFTKEGGSEWESRSHPGEGGTKGDTLLCWAFGTYLHRNFFSTWWNFCCVSRSHGSVSLRGTRICWRAGS